MASETVRQGGTAVGAVYGDDFRVEHELIREPAEVIRLAGSKYVQSDMDHVFRQVREELRQVPGLPAAVSAIRMVPARRVRADSVPSAAATSPVRDLAHLEGAPVKADIQEMTRVRPAAPVQVRVPLARAREEVRQPAEAAWIPSRWKKKAA